MSPDEIADGSRRVVLGQKRISRTQIPALTQQLSATWTMNDAYAVQKAWVERKLADGRKVTGYKIGLTSRAMQTGDAHRHTGFRRPARRHGVRQRQPPSRPAISPIHASRSEFAFVLEAAACSAPTCNAGRGDGRDGLRRSGARTDCRAQLSHRPGKLATREPYSIRSPTTRRMPVTSSARHEIDPTGVDFALGGCDAVPEWRRRGNGSCRRRDGPSGAHGIRWVCKRFAPHGIGLEPGQIILAGSFTRPVAVSAGDRIFADYGPHGSIEVAFS